MTSPAEAPEDLAALEGKATKFAEDLTATVRAVVGDDCPPFRVLTLRNSLTVSQQPDEGIVLTRGGVPLATLVADYYCTWDRAYEFLKIETSKIGLYLGENSGGVPLFRYEYERKSNASLPGAHLRIHDDQGTSHDLRTC